MNIDWKLLAGVLIAAALAVQSAAAQDAPGNGLGNTPMAPPGPVSPGWQNRPVVPGPPVQPAPASRPPSWPGGGGSESSPWVPPDQRPRRRRARPAEHFPPAKCTPVRARESSAASVRTVILESEVMPPVNEWYLKNKDRMPPDELEAQRHAVDQTAAAKPHRDPADLSGRQADDSRPRVGRTSRRNCQGVRGSRVGEDDEAVGRRLAPRVGPPTPRLGHFAGKGEAGVLRARAGPPVGRPANQARRRNHLRPDASPTTGSTRTSSPSRPGRSGKS